MIDLIIIGAFLFGLLAYYLYRIRQIQETNKYIAELYRHPPKRYQPCYRLDGLTEEQAFEDAILKYAIYSGQSPEDAKKELEKAVKDFEPCRFATPA